MPVAPNSVTLVSVANKILDAIRPISGFLFALALAYFLYGLLQYVTVLDEKKKKEARDTIFYGVIGLFVMASIWGLVALVQDILLIK